MYLARPLPFPPASPPGFPALANEPRFDPDRHLALERPDAVTGLEELGYGAHEIAASPTRLAMTSCFRVLSEEGVACLLEVARALEPHARSIERIPRMVRGGVYQSRFLRDLCLSPEVTEALSEICGAPLAPHTIPHQLGHLNYSPPTLGANVDKWHVDTLRIDYVMFVTDPNAIDGGEFEYFLGTRHEADALHAAGRPLPGERVVAPRLPGAGFAVLQQGNLVVHRTRALRRVGERITMVNGYVPRDVDYPDYTRFDQLYLADPQAVASAEYARHAAWYARERLQGLIEQAPDGASREAYAARLAAIAAQLAESAQAIRGAGDAVMEHFGDGEAAAES